ncbi:hypothetical protein K458DRAFT_131810 [Lentithecium fluviatile CBS 122367]|uniref:Uncharacterized protein n=1 Tax=Lentithecium fluviatile CBS 122367 TaxID=1168545 RepID=A0A6G1JGY9_9PLEO|nr:hypothetical protein K458DRAFT_131810 [Lentithecium fluviatile CBS 122367]
METRPCHHSSSRIHALTCGHIIAVPRNAEPCAANCAPNITLSSLCFKLPIPAPHVGVLEKIRKSIVEGVNAYGAAFAGNDRALEAKVAVHVEILRGVWERQERRILPVPDLMGGDFSCVKCGNEGHRVAFPAHTLADDPYWCIVVGREARDRAIIAELEKGAFQEPLDYQYRYRFQARQQHQQQDGKRGASESLIRAAQLGRYVRNARVTKARVEEKKRVVEQLWDEALLEEVGALDFGI